MRPQGPHAQHVSRPGDGGTASSDSHPSPRGASVTMRSDITLWAIRGMGLTVGILIVLGLVALGVTAASVLLTLFIAVLQASALEPIVGAGRERLRLGRGWTILAVYLVFMVSVIAFAFIVVPAALDQAEEIIASLPPFFQAAKAWAAEIRPAALARSVTALIESVAGILEPPPPPDPDTVVEVGAAVA